MRPFSVNASASKTAGLENLTKTLVSSADHRFTVNDPPAVTSRCVTAVLSMPTPISTGSIDSCVIQLAVMPFHSSPDARPDDRQRVGELPRDAVEQLVGRVVGHFGSLGSGSAVRRGL